MDSTLRFKMTGQDHGQHPIQTVHKRAYNAKIGLSDVSSFYNVKKKKKKRKEIQVTHHSSQQSYTGFKMASTDS